MKVKYYSIWWDDTNTSIVPYNENDKTGAEGKHTLSEAKTIISEMCMRRIKAYQELRKGVSAIKPTHF